jgi:long-subunit acyl-CoA synthetase (AMP-forming)
VTAGGKNVPPANIEARFVDDPVIERVVVYGDGRPYLVAAVWVRAERRPRARCDRRRRRDEGQRELAATRRSRSSSSRDDPLTVESRHVDQRRSSCAARRCTKRCAIASRRSTA